MNDYIGVCRSKEFHHSFGHIAEIQALVPPGTPYMTLTATATKSVHIEVMKLLEMDDCVEISSLPTDVTFSMKCVRDLWSAWETDVTFSMKCNIFYEVCERPEKPTVVYALL